MTKKKDFKSKASSIFKDVMNGKGADTQLHKIEDKKMRSAEHAQNKKKSNVVRLHVFIRYDIEKKLLEEVFKRKQDPNTPQNRSNKRAIIEEALGVYFAKSNGH